MTPHDLERAVWRTSSRSSGNGNCVEAAALDGRIAVRDSKDRSGPVLIFAAASWHTFLAGIDRFRRDGDRRP